MARNPKFTVVVCVVQNWKKEIFAGMGDYAVESDYFYTHFSAFCREQNVRVVRSDFRCYDYERKVFTKGWILDEIMGWTRVNDIKADVVHDLSPSKKHSLDDDRKYFAAKKMLAANPLRLEKIIADKYKNYRKFKQFYPKTFEVDNQEGFIKALKKFSVAKIVVKPKTGSSATGVRFLDTATAADSYQVTETVLVQELVKASPVMDYRIVYCNQKYLHAYCRQAKAGSYLVNMSKGGSMWMIDKHELPKAVTRVWRQLTPYFKEFKYSMITVDFMIAEQTGEAKIIEMNSKPGKVIYRPNGAHEGFDDIMAATLKNYQIVFRQQTAKPKKPKKKQNV